jgi:hypothetical protein
MTIAASGRSSVGETERVFDDLLREVKKLSGSQLIEIQMPLDDDGYLDRECPSPECETRFKVLFTDWREKVPDEKAWCAICGHADEPPNFNTPEQNDYIRAHAVRHVQRQLDAAFRRATPRTQKAGFISMRLTYRPGAPVVVVPYEATSILEQRSICEKCGCRFASLGAAFFCPACAHNSALTTFQAAVDTARRSMDLATRLPELMHSPAAAADLARQLTEDALVRLWSSFQRFAEAAYEQLGPGHERPRRNAFQNLEESDRLWGQAIQRTYANLLTIDEHRELVKVVQQRHVRVHKDGLIDQDYVDHSGDTSYRVGQRLVVKPSAVQGLADIVEKLASALRDAMPS